MADPTAEPGATPDPAATAGADTTTTTQTDPKPGNGDADLGDGGKRALDAMRRENRALAKERDALLASQREREDSERSELERAQAKLSESEARIAGLEREQRVREAGERYGIPPKHWPRLVGDTLEELDADAKAYAEDLGASSSSSSSASRPDLGGGARDHAPATGSAAFSERLRQQAQRRR